VNYCFLIFTWRVADHERKQRERANSANHLLDEFATFADSQHWRLETPDFEKAMTGE
jgi:hypothetical protein